MKTNNRRMRPLASLAMGLALVSIPMQAMAQEHQGDRGGHGGWRGADVSGGERRGGGGPMPGQPQGQPQGRPQGQPGWGGGNAAPAARPAPPAPPAPAAPGGMNGGWNGGNRGPDRGGWNGGPGNVQPQRNDGPRGDMQRGDGQRGDWQRRDEARRDEGRRDGPRPGEGWRGGNESWRGTPGWPQGGVNRGPQGWDRGPQGGFNRGPGMNAPRGDYRRWTQDWRRDNRYDWQRYRSSNRMAFHIGRYNPPYRGYAYRRLSVGLFLQPLFYSQSYVIYDPYNYRLPAVYGPYQWVRYYDDALLVDTYTGEVVDVLYDFFW